MEDGESDDLSEDDNNDVGNEYDFANDIKNNSFGEDDLGGFDEFGHPIDAGGNLRGRVSSLRREKSSDDQQIIGK